MTNTADFDRELQDLIHRHLEEGDECPGCMAQELFLDAISLAITVGDVCWPKHLPESHALVKALIESIARHSDGWYRGETASPPGVTLQ